MIRQLFNEWWNGKEVKTVRTLTAMTTEDIARMAYEEGFRARDKIAKVEAEAEEDARENRETQ